MNRNLDISSETLTQIEDYLLGNLSAEERQALAASLADDINLQEKVEQVKLMTMGIQEIALAERMQEFHASLPLATTEPAKIRGISIMKRWMVAASVLVVMSVGGWFVYKNLHQNQQLYADYFKPDPGLITAMSSTDNYVFDKAMVDYKTGNYSKSIATWKELQQNNPNSDTLNYFLGVASLAEDKSADAILYLQKVIPLKQSYFIKDAYWYIGLAMIKENRLTEALSFIHQSDHPDKEVLMEKLKIKK